MYRILFTILCVALMPSMALALTFQESAFNGTGGTSVTFSAQGIGTAAANRYVIVAFTSDCNCVYADNAISIGGITATIVATSSSLAAGRLGIAIANVPTGTTADIVITATADDWGIGVYTDTNVSTTVFDKGSDAKSGTNQSLTATLNTPASGFAIGVTYNQNDDPATYAWTNLTERYDEDTRSNAHQSGASGSPGAQSGYIVTADVTSSSAKSGLLVASLQYVAASTPSAALVNYSSYWL